jgi:hypothetical protein
MSQKRLWEDEKIIRKKIRLPMAAVLSRPQL